MIFFNENEFNTLNIRLRNCWDAGSIGALDGIIILNHMIAYLHKTTSYSVKDIIQKIWIKNSDLIRLSPSKIISYLNSDNIILYQRKL